MDGYKVGHPDTPECDALSVPLKDGSCRVVGALGSECPNGFEVTGGACLPFFPKEACAAGLRAVPGASSCETVDIACSTTGFGVYAGAGVYVQQGASGTGDGPSSPVPTIAQGIARAKELGVKNVWIASGVYEEDSPIVIDAPIVLNGNCPSAVVLHGGTAAPVVELREGASGGGLFNVSITGGSTGIRVTGVSKVDLTRVWIHDVNGPGVVFDGVFDMAAEKGSGLLLPDGGLASDAGMARDDAGAGPQVGGHLAELTIEDVRGSGVEIWGSDVEMTSSVLKNIAPLNDLLPGRGVGLHPSAVSYPSWAPRRSALTMIRTAITNVHSAGILVEGSDATIEESLVSGVLPDETGHGQGVVVEPRVATNVPSTLALRHVLVEHTDGVGVQSWSSVATLDSVTVRDTGEGKGSGCTGNGVRIRLDSTAEQALGAPPLDGPLVKIARSVIERTRESAIHVAGARVDIEDSILRGTLQNSCEGAYGDGVAAHSFPDRPAEVRVSRSRIEHSARAGIASFGARGSVTESVLGCNAGDITRASSPDPITMDVTSRCGCDPRWAACNSTIDAALAPPLRGAMGCEDGDACVSLCLTDWFGTRGVTRIPGATLWSDDDRRAPAFSGKDGCMELGVTSGGWPGRC